MLPDSDRPLKVSLVLSGAVALGSYEAGVACELLAAVAMGAPITFDLIAGSSAGALIAATVVKSVVAGQSPAALESWSGIDLERLTSRYESARQAAARHKPLDQGLLSSEMVRRLCAEFIRQTLRDPTFRPRFPAAKVGLVITMTNLDGLPGAGTVDDPGHFGETVTFTFTPECPAQPARSTWDRAVWERVSLVARASSAFPGAFDPESVPYSGRLSTGRVEELWANATILDRLVEERPGVQERMPYTDGGIMDNHPLERAVAALPLVTPPEDTHCLVFDPYRCFVLVQPEPPLTSLHTHERPRRLPEVVSRSFRLVEASLTMDIPRRRLLAANARLLTLLRFLAGLARRLDDGPPPHAELLAVPAPPQYSAGVDAFYAWLSGPHFGQDTAWLREAGGPYLPDRRPLLSVLRSLRQAYLDLPGGDPANLRRTLREVHVALGSQLGLTQPWLLVSDISPIEPGVRLYGNEVAHFGAFLSRAFLAHDFAVGRYYAQRWLNTLLPDWEVPVRPAPPSMPADIDPALLLANVRPFARMTGRALALMTRAGWDLPAMLRRVLRAGAALLLAGSLVQVLLWTAIAWMSLGGEPRETHLHALALAMAASILPVLVGFLAGFLVPRRPLLGLLARIARTASHR